MIVYILLEPSFGMISVKVVSLFIRIRKINGPR